MSVWIIDPREPLIFRDGKPFDPAPGVRAQSLPFPFPSTIAGGVRTLAGLDAQGRFTIPRDNLEELKKLKKLAIKGPILVELGQNGLDSGSTSWLVPAPGDALVQVQSKETETSHGQITQLVPLAPDEKIKTDLDQESPLLFVGQKEYKKEKPNKRAPRYWYWPYLERWLSHPESYEKEPVALAELGHNGPSEQVRVHVAIDPKTRAGRDQYLFDTVGMEFTALVRDTNSSEEGVASRLRQSRPLGMAVIVNDDTPYAREVGRYQRLSSLGGEKRLVSWRESQTPIPSCPEYIKETIRERKYCRIVLLTPTFFKKGYYPTTCLQSPKFPSVHVTLQAVKVDRSQVVSGFDIADGRRRKTRRLAPAGTVLFLNLEGDEGDIARWVDATWMSCLSEGEGEGESNGLQERRDGFGLAVLGIWPGK